MTHHDAHTARVHHTLNKMSKQRPARHGGDAQTNTEERTVHRQAVPICQAATETSQSMEDIRGRWADDGGQNTITLIDDVQSF